MAVFIISVVIMSVIGFLGWAFLKALDYEEESNQPQRPRELTLEESQFITKALELRLTQAEIKQIKNTIEEQKKDMFMAFMQGKMLHPDWTDEMLAREIYINKKINKNLINKGLDPQKLSYEEMKTLIPEQRELIEREIKFLSDDQIKVCLQEYNEENLKKALLPILGSERLKKFIENANRKNM